VRALAELGDTLRRVRLDRGLTLDDVAQEIRIRARYLAALEDEELQVLPGHAYARSFVRAYAGFLGLEPQPLLDELEARGDESELEPAVPSLAVAPLLPPATHGRLLTLLGIAGAAVVLAVLGWHRGSDAPAAPVARSAVLPVAPAPPPPTHAVSPRPAGPLRVALVAGRGDCWLAARAGSETGALLYQGLLATGGSLRFRRNLIWFRLGAPWNVELRVNGRRLTLPSHGQVVNVLVTRTGVRTL
jgi:transcriptional regulator with XRE-family HTH domain